MPGIKKKGSCSAAICPVLLMSMVLLSSMIHAHVDIGILFVGGNRGELVLPLCKRHESDRHIGRRLIPPSPDEFGLMDFRGSTCQEAMVGSEATFCLVKEKNNSPPNHPEHLAAEAFWVR